MKNNFINAILNRWKIAHGIEEGYCKAYIPFKYIYIFIELLDKGNSLGPPGTFNTIDVALGHLLEGNNLQ